MKMRRPALWASLMVGAAAAHIFFTRGVAGAFLPRLSQAFLLAPVISLLVALTVIPALSLLILAGERPKGPSAAVGWLQRNYDRVSAWAVGAILPATIVFVVVILAGLVAIPFLDRARTPSFEERDLLIQIEAAPGTSLVRMD